MTENVSHFVDTGGFRTHYYDEGSGKPVILLHGGGAGADGHSNWERCLPHFSRRMRTLVVDMVGFGRSEKPDPAGFTYSQDARTEQLIAFIEALGLGAVSIVGNSMGGATALGVVTRRPDLVENLVLMGSAGLDAEFSEALAPVMHYDFTVEGMRKIIAVLANASFDPPEDQVRYRYELSIQPDTRAAYKATMAWVREHGMSYADDTLRQVKTRTLVVNGKDDLVVPVTHAYKFLELLENSTGYILPNCRHWAMIEYPEVFSQVTLDFLTGYSELADQ
jgi:pimeloyl-ACP methyl ester carboxylesterase